MNHASSNAIGALWAAWALYWFVVARDVKATLRRETPAARLLHVGPLLICAVLFVAPRILPAALDRRFLPSAFLLSWIGSLMVAAGLAFAVWARRHLGRNWSGAVALKREHALIRSGPYRFVRHPIYAGLLLAILGSAVAFGEWRGLLGLAFAFIAIIHRVRAEDALMSETFGEEYRDYRRHTKALLPFLV
ncbi:MAG: methyltransferase family protein [Hyphomicrobiales bacterium]